MAAIDPDALERLTSALAPDLAGRIPCHPVARAIFDELSPGPIETGVIALARRPEIDPRVPLSAGGPAILLDAPTHHGNVGAVVRVAAAADASAVLTTGPLDPWHPSAIRGAAGLHFALPVVRFDEVASLERPLIAIDPAGEPLQPASLPERAIYAFGSERRGLSPALLARADQRLALPMRPGVSSLNLATAVAVVLYALRLRASSGACD